MRWFAVVVLVGCKFAPGEAPADADVDVPDDVSIDATAGTCYGRWLDGTIRFAEPVELTTVNSSVYDRDPFLTPDELTLYVSSGRTVGTTDLFVATRGTRRDPFTTPVDAVTFDDTMAYESKLSMTQDGLLAVVGSTRTSSQMLDVWSATRTAITGSWSPLTKLAGVNTAGNEHDPTISADGLHLYLAPQDFVTPQHVALATRGSRSDVFGAPTTIPEIYSGMGDADPSATPDERILLFSTSRPQPGAMFGNVWYATRSSKDLAFSAPAPVPDINTNFSEGDPHLSTDGCRIYFGRDVGSGNWNIYVATAVP